jgi:O-methyltransferase involved in polyketide biosynthesis
MLAAARMARHAMSRTETRMTKQTANQQRSLEAFMAKKAEFDALLAELTWASEEHFGADPEGVLWGETTWLADATVKLKDIADAHFKRGEYAA